MSLVVDEEKIALAAKILELALEIGDDVYAKVSDALKQAHPKLVSADVPPNEADEMKKDAEDMIRKKFEKGEPT